MYDHPLKLSEYKLFHGQTLFVLNRPAGPLEVSSEVNELSDTKRAIDACFSRLREDTPALGNTRDYLISLMKKLSEKYTEMGQELTVCADLLSRPNGTSIPAHWKDLAAFRRKAFAVSEATAAISSILYGTTLATSAALAQGQPQGQFIIPPTINMNWSKTFDSFGQAQTTQQPRQQQQQQRADSRSILNQSSSSSEADSDERHECELPFNFAQFNSLFSQRRGPNGERIDSEIVFQRMIACVRALAQNLSTLPRSMTLDKFFNVPAVAGGIFYEVLSKLTVATAMEILSGSVQRLDDSLMILKRLLQARSTDLQFYVVNSREWISMVDF